MLCSDCKKQQQNTLVILAGGESITRPITMSLSTVCSTASVLVLKEQLKEWLEEQQAIVGL